MKTSELLLLLATVVTALMASLFYAYSCSVVPGLGRLKDLEYLGAMQSINRAILNPVFLCCFMGALLLLPLSAWSTYRDAGLTTRCWLLIAAGIAYALGVFGVTMLGNVPMNEVLDKIRLAGSAPDQLRTQRAVFENRWNTLNNIRSLFAIVALIFAVLACMSRTARGAGMTMPVS